MLSSPIAHHHPGKLQEVSMRLDYNLFSQEMSSALYELGKVEGLQRKLHNPNLLISPLTTKEATVSSKIEGTQSTISDVYMYEASGRPKYDDTPQVLNYRTAMNNAVTELRKGRPLSAHLIKSLHHTLLDGVRFKGSLGEFRQDKVWIAEKKGDPPEKAIYTPPEHFLVAGYMDELIHYIENSTDNALIKAGLVHYQFEAVHPFDDGNGRIGRLLIPLILNYQHSLTQPILYISGYFDAHRDEYLESLHDVDKNGTYESWLKFFFISVTAQLKLTQDLISEIYGWYDKVRESFKVTKSPYLIPFLDFIFISPVFSVPMILKFGIGTQNRTTINNLIEMFMVKKFVVDTHTYDQRAKIYEFKPLLERL